MPIYNVLPEAFNPHEETIEIARYDPEKDEFRIRIRALSKTFADGGKIRYFAFRKTPGEGYGFIRYGKDIEGKKRSEGIKTTFDGKSLKVIKVEKAVWMITCSLGTCTFCAPNYDGDDCECPVMGGDIWDTFVVDANGDRVGDKSIDEMDGTTECGSPSTGAGLYDTEVVN